MNINSIIIDSSDARRLLGAASGDAALLYIYLRCGNDPATAEQMLKLPQGRLACAMATLRQLGLWQEEKRSLAPCGERPNYSEADVLQSLDTDPSFRRLYGEIRRRLGRHHRPHRSLHHPRHAHPLQTSRQPPCPQQPIPYYLFPIT